MSLHELLGELQNYSSGHSYTALPVPGRSDSFLAVDVQGRPSLFVRALEPSGAAPLRTRRVALRLAQRFTLVSPGREPLTGVFHSLVCEAAESADVETFLVLVEAFLARQGDRPVEETELTAFFRSMVRLFSEPPARDVKGERQGLWGELFLMSRVRGFRFWAPFWHSEPTRRFDFSSGGRRLEVKTSTGALRIHHFSHRQIYALNGEEILIASLLLRDDDSGLSLRELIREARAALEGTADYLKLERSVRRAAMERDEPGPIFDAREAEQSLAWFWAAEAPHFRVPEPPGVSETGYRVDLTLAPAASASGASEWIDGWFASPQQAEGLAAARTTP